MVCMIAGTAALRFSTWVMRRARARRSPPSMRSTSAAGSLRRGVASGPAIGERPDSNTWPRGATASPGRPERWGVLEERHGFAGALRTLGGLEERHGFAGALRTLGGFRGAPRLRRGAPNAGGYGGPFRGPPCRRLLRTDEDEIGRHLDVVGDLEEQQLWDLQTVLGEGRVELRLDLEVVAREAEALLLLHLLGRQLDVRHGGLGDLGHRLLLDRE